MTESERDTRLKKALRDAEKRDHDARVLGWDPNYESVMVAYVRIDDLRSIRAEVERLKEWNSELADACDQMRADRRDFEAEIARPSEENRQLVGVECTVRDAAESELRGLREEAERLRAENDKLNTAVSVASKHVEQYANKSEILAEEITRLREALVEERAAKIHLEEWIDAPEESTEAGLACPWEEIPEDLEMSHKPGVFWKANYREKARVISSTPESSPPSSSRCLEHLDPSKSRPYIVRVQWFV